MPADANDIADWYDQGVDMGYRRMVVWMDTFDYSDYPEYSKVTGESLKAEVKQKHAKGVSRLMEVYDLTQDRDRQLVQRRVWNY